MANKVIQLKNRAGTDNLFPIAGGTTQNTVTRGMLAEGVFEGTTLSEPSSVAYVATANIQDGAVTPAKIDFTIQDVTGAAPTSFVNSSSPAYSVVIKRWGRIIDVRVVLPMAKAVSQDATADLLTSLPIPALTLATSIPAVIGRDGTVLLGIGSGGNLLLYGAHPAISATDTIRTHFTYLAAS